MRFLTPSLIIIHLSLASGKTGERGSAPRLLGRSNIWDSSLPEHSYHCLNIFIIVWTFAFVISTFHFFIFTKLVLQIGELVGEGLNDRRVPVSKDHESLNAIDWRDKSYILEKLTMSWGLPHQGPWGPGILGRKRTYIYTSLPGPPLSSIFTLQTLCL